MTARPTDNSSKPRPTPPRPVYPFTALVGQDEMKLALLLNVIAPTIGGVLIMGHRGTGKSTAVRALADLLPPLRATRDCPYNCDPRDTPDLCDECRARLDAKGKLSPQRRPVPVIDLPLGATEDRVCGTIDIERALNEGVKIFEPGLLARANRGFLYIDEVNLLEDHLVDLLLDASVTGRNGVEREGVSVVHPARFVLVGSGNPEEGELRPQLLDRFGLYTEVQTALDLDERVLIVEQREAFERDPTLFVSARKSAQLKLRRRLQRAQREFVNVEVPRPLLREIVELCVRLKVDGHRSEITIARAARALAAFEGRRSADTGDVRRVAAMALRHRLRRDPLEQTSSAARIEETIEELFGEARARDERDHAFLPHDEHDDGHDGGDFSGGNESGQARQSSGVRGDGGGTRQRNERAQSPRNHAEERTLPPAETSNLPDETFRPEKTAKNNNGLKTHAGRRERARHSADARRGRYVRASVSKHETGVVAVDATLRAAASSRVRRREVSAAGERLRLRSDDLRFKRFRRKAGTLFILAVDASGSMAVNRIQQAKGALAHLLRRSYLNRDRVALVSFRGRGAELLLPPSNSPARAKTILDALPVGGPTPLSAGLNCSLEVARKAQSGGARQVVLVLFTDGRANVSLSTSASEVGGARRALLESEIERLGVALRGARVAAFVVDTQNRYTSGGEGQFLAAALGGRYVYLPSNSAGHSISKAFESP